MTSSTADMEKGSEDSQFKNVLIPSSSFSQNFVQTQRNATSPMLLNPFTQPFTQALDLNSNDKNALIARSKCHLLLGNPRKALDDAEMALQVNPKDSSNAKAIYCKAEALYHLGDFEMSLVYYYRGMRIRPEFGQFRLGVQKAKNAIQKVLRKN
nr:PREDICTED: tetratricopeptide repeat protein 25 isoform X1 [Linepithema humile]